MCKDRPMPFYAAYPSGSDMDQEREQERDMRRMKTYYSRRAAAIQELVEQECDRMEYDGSMMFDEHPDKLMMENLCCRIEDRYLQQEDNGSEEMQAMQSRRNRRGEHRDLIGVLLFNEIFCRRCRHRCRHNFHY